MKQRHTLGKATPATVGDDDDLADRLLAAGPSPMLHTFLFGWIRSQGHTPVVEEERCTYRGDTTRR